MRSLKQRIAEGRGVRAEVSWLVAGASSSLIV